MRASLNQLVRDQILAEGPDDVLQAAPTWEQSMYVDGQLNAMTRVELLERISDALAVIQSEQSVRLGL
jgi:hypothetical protein